METKELIIMIAKAAVIIGGAAYVYARRDKIKRFFKNNNESSKVSTKTEKEIYGMANVHNDFLMYADTFQGLYEALYKTSKGMLSLERANNILTEWDIRTDNIPNCPINLKSWWNITYKNGDVMMTENLSKIAGEVISMITGSGIIRDSRLELSADKTSNLYYQQMSGNKINEGEKMHVKSPCWYINTDPVRIIEKGYCEKI